MVIMMIIFHKFNFSLQINRRNSKSEYSFQFLKSAIYGYFVKHEYTVNRSFYNNLLFCTTKEWNVSYDIMPLSDEYP